MDNTLGANDYGPSRSDLPGARGNRAVPWTGGVSGRAMAFFAELKRRRVGKVALGCRNQACTFSELTVQGQLVERPKRQVAGAQQ